MFNKIKDYVFDEKFKMIYFSEKLNIVNYVDIVLIDPKKIIVSTIDNNVLIKGNNLHLKKLLDNEILIAGEIKNIELER